MASSPNSRDTRTYSTLWPLRQALWAKAQASQLLPMPVDPQMRCSPDPAPVGEGEDKLPVEAASVSEVDVLDAGVMLELGAAQPVGELPRVALGELAVDEQAEPLLKRQGRRPRGRRAARPRPWPSRRTAELQESCPRSDESASGSPFRHRVVNARRPPRPSRCRSSDWEPSVRDAGVADQHVSQATVWDIRERPARPHRAEIERQNIRLPARIFGGDPVQITIRSISSTVTVSAVRS